MKEYKTFTNEYFEIENEYNAIKIASITKEEKYFDIISFKFYPIFVGENYLQYNITQIDKPDVVLNSTGLVWKNASWGSTNCIYQSLEKYLECTIEEDKNSYSSFAFQTDNNYNAGTLVIIMKVLNPNQNINFVVIDRNEIYHYVNIIKPSTEYEEYRIQLPSFESYASYKYALIEGSQLENIYYIKSIIYYSPNTPIPESNNTITTTTTTKTEIISTSIENSIENSIKQPQKIEKEIYRDKGYESCSINTKIAFIDENGI